MSKSRKRFTPFTLDNAWFVEFPTPDGVLRIGPGLVRVEARLSVRETDDEGYWWTLLDCELRLADADGKLWQATSTFSVYPLFYGLIDLSRREPGRWLRKAPAEWRTAVTKRSLLSGVQATYDDRFYRFAWFDNTGFCWQFKYFGATFDIAAFDASTLLVQVSKLWCTWNPVPVAGEDGEPLPLSPRSPPLSDEEAEEQMERWEEAGEAGDVEETTPLAYLLDAGRLLFSDSARIVMDVEHRTWEGWSVPRTPVFRPAKGKGEPQSFVTYRAASLTPATPESKSTKGFVEVEDRYGSYEFQTNADGRLVVQSAKLSVKIDKHPGNASEPVDVLRCRVRVTDESGDVWEAVTHCTPEVFFAKLIDLDTTHAPGFGPAKPKGKWLLTGIRAHVDVAWRYAFIGNELIAYRGEQSPAVAIVQAEDSDELIVRITGLVGRRRPVDIDRDYLTLDPEARTDERQRWEQDAPLPPLVFTMSMRHLIFRNTTFAVDDGFWHRNAIPIPVVFSRVGKGEPCAGVRFVAGVE